MKFDARKLSTYEQVSLRKHAVQLVESGESPIKVTRLLDLGEKTIYRWLRECKEDGIEALEPKQRTGRNRLLDEKQAQEVIYCVLHQSPVRYGYEGMFWTRSIISDLILKKYNVTICLTSVSKLLERHGVYPQKEIKLAYNNTNSNIKKWLKSDYTKIKFLARKHRAKVLWAGFDSVLMQDGVNSKDTKTKNGQLYSLSPIGFISLTLHTGGFVFLSQTKPLTRSHMMKIFEFVSEIIEKPIYVILNSDDMLLHENQNDSLHSLSDSVFLFTLPGNDFEYDNDVSNRKMSLFVGHD